MNELKFITWMDKNSKGYNTARSYTARCHRVENEMNINLDEEYKKDQGKHLMQLLKYSRKEEREGSSPKCGIEFDVDVDVYAGMHSIRASVKKYFEYLQQLKVEG